MEDNAMKWLVKMADGRSATLEADSHSGRGTQTLFSRDGKITAIYRTEGIAKIIPQRFKPNPNTIIDRASMPYGYEIVVTFGAVSLHDKDGNRVFNQPFKDYHKGLRFFEAVQRQAKTLHRLEQSGVVQARSLIVGQRETHVEAENEDVWDDRILGQFAPDGYGDVADDNPLPVDGKIDREVRECFLEQSTKTYSICA